MVYSQNEIRHSKENEGTTTSRNSIDEFQKVARYKIVHVIFIYIIRISKQIPDSMKCLCQHRYTHTEKGTILSVLPILFIAHV